MCGSVLEFAGQRISSNWKVLYVADEVSVEAFCTYSFGTSAGSDGLSKQGGFPRCA